MPSARQLPGFAVPSHSRVNPTLLAAGVRRAAAARHLQAGRLGSALAELAAAGDGEGAAAALSPLVADVAAALAESPQPGAY
jgi:hypothetical protein